MYPLIIKGWLKHPPLYYEGSEIVTGIGVQPYCVVTGKGQLWLHQKLGINSKILNQFKLDLR